MARRVGEEPSAAARTRSARGAVAAAPHTPCDESSPAMSAAGGRFIGARGAAALRRYKYTAVDRSIIAPYFQPFWTRFVQLVPLWLAPNCITVGGLALVVLSCALSWHTSPTLDAPLPVAIILAHAGLLFAYQTLDAVDGKQARRTGSSGPLGELCDHTCDALVCTFAGLSMAATLQAGGGGAHTALLMWVVGTGPFCLATWRMFLTGVMTLPEFNGPNEGLALLYCTHTATALLGQARVWGPPLALWGLRLQRAQAYAGLGIVMALVDGRNHVRITLAAVRARGQSRRFAILLLLPYLALVGFMVAWAALSPEDVAYAQPYLFLLGCGFQFALLMGRIILGHLCDEHDGMLAAMWQSLAPLPLAVANAASARVLGEPLLPEIWFLWLNCAYGVGVYVRFAMGVTAEITELLGIKCFSLPKKRVVA